MYQSALGAQYGFPQTSFTTSKNFTVGSNATLDIPVVWGLAGVSTGVGINALASFPVTATVVFPGRTLVASSSILVPVGAGIL